VIGPQAGPGQPLATAATTADAAPATIRSGPVPAPATTQAAPSAAPVDQATAPMTAAQIEEARAVVSRQMKALKTISRGVWISRSTLEVDRVSGDEDAAMAEICAVLTRYPDLSFSRIQLNPPAGSDQAVHWRQCGATVVVPH
jgi:hypothetical protein